MVYIFTHTNTHTHSGNPSIKATQTRPLNLYPTPTIASILMVGHSGESATDICRGSDLKLHQKLRNVKLRGGSTLISPHLAVRWNSLTPPPRRMDSTALSQLQLPLGLEE